MEEKNLGTALTACYFCGKSGNTENNRHDEFA